MCRLLIAGVSLLALTACASAEALNTGPGSRVRTIEPPSFADHVFDARRMFGVGTGAADNAPLINNAMLYCYNHNGGVVQLPPGVLDIQTTIGLRRGCLLKGRGAGQVQPGEYGYAPPRVGTTVIKWTGAAGAAKMIAPAHWGSGASTNIDWRTGVQDLVINGNFTTPSSSAGPTAIYMQSSGYDYFYNVDIANVAFGMYFYTQPSAGDLANQSFTSNININNCYEGLFIAGTSSSFFDYLNIWNVYGIGINFYANSDSNTFGHATIFLDSNVSGATGVVFNSSNPSGSADIFAETFDYLFVSTQTTSQYNVIQNYSADGGFNSIRFYEAVGNPGYTDPVINAGGYLDYSQFYSQGAVTHNMAGPLVFNGFVPTVDSTCIAGGGSSLGPRAGSTLNAGTIHVGNSATQCVVSTGPAFTTGAANVNVPNNVHCVATDLTGARALWIGSVPTNTGFTVFGLTGGDYFSYICL